MFSMKGRLPLTASPACTTPWRVPLRISFPATKYARLPRHPARRLGYPRSAGGDRGGKGQLGFTNKGQIETYGIASVQRAVPPVSVRVHPGLGALHRPHRLLGGLQTAYVTYKNEYIESVWWILKTFWDKGPALPRI